MTKKEAAAKEEAKEVLQWDLTDEEVEAYYDWGFQLSVKEKPTASWFIHEAAGRRAVAWGEARKLVEWLHGQCKHHPDEDVWRKECPQCMTTLRKEFGMDEYAIRHKSGLEV